MPPEARKESPGISPGMIIPTIDEDMGWTKDELARQLGFPLMQRTYVEPWKVPEVCEAIRSDK
jgi:hypothetical protein